MKPSWRIVLLCCLSECFPVYTAIHSYPLPSYQVLDLLTIDSTSTEDIAKLRSHILMSIQSESVFLCSESILPKSYEAVEQAIHTLATQEEIPQHGKWIFNYKDSDINQNIIEINCMVIVQFH